MYNLLKINATTYLILVFSSILAHASSFASSSYESGNYTPVFKPKMRLSAQIEVPDLRPFVTQNPTYQASTHIRFCFKHDPATEIGRIAIDSLVKNVRLGIKDDIFVPDIDNVVITYDFRNNNNERIGGSWECSSKDNPTGKLSRQEEEGFINAVRLEAIARGNINHGPVRFLLVGYPRYGNTNKSQNLVSSTFGELAVESTFLNDPALVKQALDKYSSMTSLAQSSSSSSESENEYMTITPQLKDSSLLIAGEYIKLARAKYGKYPQIADADALLALMRAYGIVSTRTALELAEQLGLS